MVLNTDQFKERILNLKGSIAAERDWIDMLTELQAATSNHDLQNAYELAIVDATENIEMWQTKLDRLLRRGDENG